MNEFCHLHTHNDYSVLDGFGSCESHVQKIKQLGHKYLGLTNHGNIDGLIRFQKCCIENDIKPILGCELYIVPDLVIKNKDEKRGHIVALVKNDAGWKNLTTMLTKANIDGFYHKPRVDFQTYLSHSDGIITTTACAASFINIDGGIDFLKQLLEVSQVFCEIMPISFEDQKQHNKNVIELAEKLVLDIVATNDAHYPEQEDAKFQEILLAIQTKVKWADPKRWKFETNDLYLKSREEMVESFKTNHKYISESIIDKALDNTIKIAESCNFLVKKSKVFMPKVDTFGKDQIDIFKEYCKDGLYEKIISKGIKSHEYRKRLVVETKTIQQQGFIEYFLIIRDIVQWCRSNDILVGPSRGSVGASLVAFLLDITSVDPIKYNLMFERFISPERTDLPDIDVDFEDIRRKDVQAYIKSKYGEYNVASVSTFLQMKSKMVFKDVCRVFEIPMNEVNAISPFIENIKEPDYQADGLVDNIKSEVGKVFRGQNASPECLEFDEQYPYIIDACMKLEGQIRGIGKHAAAAIITKDDLRYSDRCNLVQRDEITSVNWDKKDAEYMGMLKVDILSLSNLSIMKYFKNLVKTNHGIDINFVEDIDLTDTCVLEEFARGNCIGVFQFGTYGLRKLCKDLKIDSFELLTHATAMYRPASLRSGMVDVFKLRRNGIEDSLHHNALDKYLASTYGIVIYQEQVMQIVNELAGLSFTDADKIRKLLDTENKEELNKYKHKFIRGCISKDIKRVEAIKIWEELAQHGGYGFNQCFSGDEIIDRGNKNNKKQLTIKEMFFIKNDKEYAKSTGHYALWKKYKKYFGKCLSMYEDFRLRPNDIVDIQYSGKQKIYRVTTASNKTACCTLNHRFPTPLGEKLLSEINIGDELYVNAGYEITKHRKKINISNNWPVKGQCGFQSKTNLVENRQILNKVRDTKNKEKCNCEICSAKYKNGFELHHKDGDSTNNSENNFIWVCNTCHKKYHYDNLNRKRKFDKGLKTIIEKIKSIEFVKEDDTYNIEMNTPYHNLVLNSGIVASNSHAVGYTMLSFWNLWAKTYFPSEFICATLTYCDPEKKTEILNEAIFYDLQIATPKIEHSDTKKWLTKNDIIYMPFIEVKGIGPKYAEKIAEIQKNSEFFNLEKTSRVKTLLNTIGAYDNKKQYYKNDLIPFDLDVPKTTGHLSFR